MIPTRESQSKKEHPAPFSAKRVTRAEVFVADLYTLTPICSFAQEITRQRDGEIREINLSDGACDEANVDDGVGNGGGIGFYADGSR